MEKIYTRKETAELLKISLRTLDRQAQLGRIKAVRIGHCVRYRESDIYNYLNFEPEEHHTRTYRKKSVHTNLFIPIKTVNGIPRYI